MSDILINGVTYRKQFRKCGNPNCRCADDWAKAHGPYWYADGTKYIGKELPEWIKNHKALLITENDHLQELKQQISERAEFHRTALRQAEDELSAISSLIRGEYVDQRVLKSIGLEKFSTNGHK